MNDLRQRQPRIECPAFLAFLRRHPCCACGAPAPSQAAHVRMSSAEHGSVNPGVGAKPDDRNAVPLCPGCHLDDPGAQHKIGERRFWARVGIDPFKMAATLYAQFERHQKRSPEQKARVAKRAKRIKFHRPLMGDPDRPNLEVEFVMEQSGVTRRVHPAKDRELYRHPTRSQWPPKGSRKLRSRR